MNIEHLEVMMQVRRGRRARDAGQAQGSATLPANVQEASAHPSRPASLAIFRVRANGKLDFVRKYDVDASNSRSLFWMGLVSLP